jgi:hypothetical protein
MFKKIESLKELQVGATLKSTIGNKKRKETEFKIMYVPTFDEQRKGKGVELLNSTNGEVENGHIDLHLMKNYLIKA